MSGADGAPRPMELSRRTFLQLSGAQPRSPRPPLGYACATNDPTTAALCRKLAVDPLRPQYHLLPAHNWMNDPNGPIFFRGRYHMFHQYNPQAAVWGNMNWAHATSPDMIHWQHEPIALSPDSGRARTATAFSAAVRSRQWQAHHDLHRCRTTHIRLPTRRCETECTPGAKRNASQLRRTTTCAPGRSSPNR